MQIWMPFRDPSKFIFLTIESVAFLWNFQLGNWGYCCVFPAIWWESGSLDQLFADCGCYKSSDWFPQWWSWVFGLTRGANFYQDGWQPSWSFKCVDQANQLMFSSSYCTAGSTKNPLGLRHSSVDVGGSRQAATFSGLALLIYLERQRFAAELLYQTTWLTAETPHFVPFDLLPTWQLDSATFR